MRKIVILTMATLIVFGSINTCWASDYDAYAEKLAAIGVFKGTGEGYELDREPTRIEGIIMLIRLLGKEDEALAVADRASVFSDVPNWAVKYTNYAYAEGLSNGIGGGLFGSDQVISADAYYTYLLRALGYDDARGDFTWNTAVEYAYSLKMMDDTYHERLSNGSFKRDDVAKSSYETLFSTLKNQEKSLIQSLVDSGDISKTIADGFILEHVEENQQEYIEGDKQKENNDDGRGSTGLNQIKITSLDKRAEFVEITNVGSESVDISGWKMVSERGDQSFYFPEGTIILPNQVIRLTSGDLAETGDFTMDHKTIWNNSKEDNAILLDHTGVQIDFFRD